MLGAAATPGFERLGRRSLVQPSPQGGPRELAVLLDADRLRSLEHPLAFRLGHRPVRPGDLDQGR